MTVFQWVTVSVLAVLVVWECAAWMRSRRRFLYRSLRVLVWLLGALAILLPGLVQMAANLLGIGRGADVVLYGFALAFLFASFAFYSRTVRLQRQITELVRRLALLEARRGPIRPDDPPREPTSPF